MGRLEGRNVSDSIEILESLPNGKKSKTVSVHKQLKRFSVFFYLHMGNGQGVVLHDSVSTSPVY